MTGMSGGNLPDSAAPTSFTACPHIQRPMIMFSTP